MEKIRVVFLDNYFITISKLSAVFRELEKRYTLEIITASDNPYACRAYCELGYRVWDGSVEELLKDFKPDIILTGCSGPVEKNYHFIKKLQIPVLLLTHGYELVEPDDYRYSADRWLSRLTEYTKFCCGSENTASRLQQHYGIEKDKLAVTGKLELDGLLTGENKKKDAMKLLGVRNGQKVISVYSSYDTDSYPFYRNFIKLVRQLDKIACESPDKYKILYRMHPFELERGGKRPDFESDVTYTMMPGNKTEEDIIPVDQNSVISVSDYAVTGISNVIFPNFYAGVRILYINSAGSPYDKYIESIFKSSITYADSCSGAEDMLYRAGLLRNETEYRKEVLRAYDEFCDEKAAERIAEEIRVLADDKRKGALFHKEDRHIVLAERFAANPDNLWVKYNYAVSFKEIGEQESCRRTIGEIVEKEKFFMPALRYLLDAAIEENDVSHAEQLCRDAMESDKTHFSSLVKFLNYIIDKDMGRAIDIYNEYAVRLDSFKRLGYYNTDIIKLRLKLEEDSEKLFSILNEFTDDFIPDENACMYIVDTLANRKLIKYLVLFYRKHEVYMKSNLSYLRPLYRTASLLKEDAPECSLEIFDSIKDIARGAEYKNYYGGAHFHSGTIQYCSGDYEKAEESFCKCIETIPSHLTAKEYLNKCRSRA